eukprot:533217_1
MFQINVPFGINSSANNPLPSHTVDLPHFTLTSVVMLRAKQSFFFLVRRFLMEQLTVTLANKLDNRKQNKKMIPFSPVGLNGYSKDIIDFSSCDYLSLTRDREFCKIYMNALNDWCKKSIINPMGFNLGRNTIPSDFKYPNDIIFRMEKMIAEHHNAESAFLFKSGTEANMGFFGCIASKNDFILLDELAHMSMKMGTKLSLTKNIIYFKHNDMNNLENILNKIRNIKHNTDSNIIIGVDSMYSMDGDLAPIVEIVNLCDKYDSILYVDEAHTTGMIGNYGSGLVCKLRLENKVFGRLISCSKAVSSSGSAIIGSKILFKYLAQYANTHIFSHVLSPANAIGIECVYKYFKTDIIKQRLNYVNNILVPFYLKQM